MELVICNNGKATTTSMKVAQYFGKQHKNVITAIEKLREDQSVEDRLNFKPISYMDSMNRLQLMYSIDRDGFTLLAMGFTGKQALQFKLAYIDAFNKAESLLQEATPAIVHDPQTRALIQLLTETDAIKRQQSVLSSQMQVVTVGFTETRNDVNHLKQNMKMENWQQHNIVKAVNHKVELWRETCPNLNVRKAYPAIYRHLKDKFKVPRYNEIPAVEYERAVTTVRTLSLNQLIGL